MLEAKLKKIEEKYVVVFKENKKLIKDKEVLEKFVSSILTEKS